MPWTIWRDESGPWCAEHPSMPRRALVAKDHEALMWWIDLLEAGCRSFCFEQDRQGRRIRATGALYQGRRPLPTPVLNHEVGQSWRVGTVAMVCSCEVLL